MDLDFILRAVQVANVKYIDELLGNFRLIPGAKTYDDPNNCGGSRVNNLYKKYKAQLSFWGKIQLFFRKVIYHSVYFTVRKIRSVYRRFP